MATTALQQITAMAKRLRKKNPTAKWQTLIKKAGKQYREGKGIPTVKKATVKRPATKRKAATKKAVALPGQSLAMHIRSAKALLLDKLAKAEGRLMEAKKVKDKNKARKEIQSLRAQYGRLS